MSFESHENISNRKSMPVPWIMALIFISIFVISVVSLFVHYDATGQLSPVILTVSGASALAFKAMGFAIACTDKREH